MGGLVVEIRAVLMKEEAIVYKIKNIEIEYVNTKEPC